MGTNPIKILHEEKEDKNTLGQTDGWAEEVTKAFLLISTNIWKS